MVAHRCGVHAYILYVLHLLPRLQVYLPEKVCVRPGNDHQQEELDVIMCLRRRVYVSKGPGIRNTHTHVYSDYSISPHPPRLIFGVRRIGDMASQIFI